MIDEELRSQILQIVREAVAEVQAQDNSAQLQTLIDELQDMSAMAAGESPYGACEGAAPGNFEPEFENGRLSRVGEGYYPVGRRFYSGATVDSSAQISSGCVWLEVVYPTSSSSSPTATIKGGASFPGNSDITATKSWMPLYKIADGRIAVDYRSAMSLTLREL